MRLPAEHAGQGRVKGVDLHWFGQMRAETRLAAAKTVFFHPVSRQRDAFQAAPPPNLVHEIVATSVGKSDVGYQEIELIVTGQAPGIGHRGGGAHVKVSARQQPLQRKTRRRVVFDQQDFRG
jgi:hypothetical protein